MVDRLVVFVVEPLAACICSVVGRAVVGGTVPSCHNVTVVRSSIVVEPSDVDCFEDEVLPQVVAGLRVVAGARVVGGWVVGRWVVGRWVEGRWVVGRWMVDGAEVSGGVGATDEGLAAGGGIVAAVVGVELPNGEVTAVAALVEGAEANEVVGAAEGATVVDPEEEFVWFAFEEAAVEEDTVDVGAAEDDEVELVEEDAVDEAAVDEDAVEEAAVDEGALEDGAVDEVAVDDEAVEEGAVEATVDEDVVEELVVGGTAGSVVDGLVPWFSWPRSFRVLPVSEKLSFDRVSFPFSRLSPLSEKARSRKASSVGTSASQSGIESAPSAWGSLSTAREEIASGECSEEPPKMPMANAPVTTNAMQLNAKTRLLSPR